MSFLDDIVGFLGSNSIGSSLAKTALSAFVLNRVQSSITKENEAKTQTKEVGVREQVDPDTEHKIPVVYGQAYVQGVVTDAALTNSDQTMWYCITLSEKTGTILSTSADSVISFKEVWWNGNKCEFGTDGITVKGAYNTEGVYVDFGSSIKIYPFNNGSTSPTTFKSVGNTANAYSLFPNWTTNHTMSGLVFALVKVDYNREKNVTGLGTLQFKLQNTMKKPGDVLYDYMTNTRYGAGIPPAEINAS